MSVEQKIRGMFLGAAIGDALGAAFENTPSALIEHTLGAPKVSDYHKGIAQSLIPGHPAGMPTDDTAMALSLAGALVSGRPITAASIAKAFLSDFAPDGAYGRLIWNGGIGGAVARALGRLERGADPAINGQPSDGGNGAVMRAHVVGALPDREAVLAVAAMQARVTHGHPAAIAAAQAVALVSHDALSGRPLSAGLPVGVTDPVLAASWAAMHAELKPLAGLPSNLRDVAMSAWESAAAAHAIAYMFADDVEGGMASAAASGGDTDTIACMVGAMLGTVNGEDALPKRWLKGLRERAAVETAADSLIDRYYPSAKRPAAAAAGRS
ncbi:MAG: ADP-ribosylglycohydrolase family protein [Candidatus Eremiobacteraeota bacterium]|nr:ADP-ribosylglycohydrolase family protein [Candidatus Eremiobacteraeota bacterium]